MVTGDFVFGRKREMLCLRAGDAIELGGGIDFVAQGIIIAMREQEAGESEVFQVCNLRLQLSRHFRLAKRSKWVSRLGRNHVHAPFRNG
jgi:hypothetical protein